MPERQSIRENDKILAMLTPLVGTIKSMRFMSSWFLVFDICSGVHACREIQPLQALAGTMLVIPIAGGCG